VLRTDSANEPPSIAIIGAGPAGLCLAIRLKQTGFHRFTIYEKSGGIGGTWHDNSYPGAGCDVPSHLYCFSFEPNPEWSRKFPLQPEIRDYLEHCARKYELLPHVRFRTEVRGARFDESAGGWRLRTGDGEEVFASVLVSATGQLNRPHVPDLPGLKTFAGPAFHSARWNHNVNLAGRRVAVIGNGASAVQIVPQVAQKAARVIVFQRSANWVLPRKDRAYSRLEKWLFRRVPLALRLHRWWTYLCHEARFFGFFRGSWLGRQIERRARKYMRAHITDPKLRATLTPDYPAGCKRILISDDYYQTLARPNVEVESREIASVSREGIVTADGTLHRADAIVLATGFQTSSFLAPMRIEGKEGRDLHEAWRGGAEAHLGMAVSGFPNLFLLYGPGTNLGHNSILFMIECQVQYVLHCVRKLLRGRLRWLDVRPEAQERFASGLQQDLGKTVWSAGCASWYRTGTGKVINNWPGFTVGYWWRTMRPDFRDFERRR
jgi:cation diffusion facilitator CzcD-associated flavoprotein CzcO